MAIQIVPSHMFAYLSMQHTNSNSYLCFKLIQNNLSSFLRLNILGSSSSISSKFQKHKSLPFTQSFSKIKFSSATSLHPPTLDFHKIIVHKSIRCQIFSKTISQVAPSILQNLFPKLSDTTIIIMSICASFVTPSISSSNCVQPNSYFDRIRRHLYTRVQSHLYSKNQASQN